MPAPAISFPGGTSVSLLDVYDDVAPDGLRGGSPHLHLASTECYVVIGGRGALHTVDAHGASEIALAEGSVVWFTPGTIHRAVNHGDLRVLVLMSNAGLPEAGDAVMTFPADIVADPGRYAAAATLPAGSENERADAAARRRNLAVEGYLSIRKAVDAGDFGPLREFQAAAAAIIEHRASSWTDIVEQGPAAQAARSLDVARALSRGEFAHLEDAAVYRAAEPAGERRFGMCGRLRPYDVREPAGRR
ncbi:cupin domain-containing protein [Microbacterium sp. M3]|uniref:Cupin domain-containing protein n=1 Tax=Microbacterium arthrosphaerae TaxID=792652 RepID=A0ABU4H4X1_9MICO|nr:MULTISPECIES: cupin domain-containing protein [Microbacterium]MDW4573710.1 cupin domain-containing protein [Microbacterium arthrosphaerae]MDW7607565.1 cupin domain-containing protein [Microbacterium sp. M3]